MDWEPLFEGIWAAWLGYREVLRPDRVLRVSTRFINRIDIPTGQNLDDYFLISPRMPEGAPDILSAYSSVMSIPYAQRKTQAFVKLGLDVSNSNQTIQAMILDLDILHPCDLAPNDNEAISSEIQDLRPLKNELFFGSLTEKALELFQ